MGKDYTMRQSLIVDGNVDETTEWFDGRKFGGRHGFVLAGRRCRARSHTAGAK